MNLGSDEENFKNEMDDLVSNDKMPFGKYKNEPIHKVDTDYLAWLVKDADWLEEPLESKLEEEFNKRMKKQKCFGHLEINLRKCKKCPFYDECAEKTEELEQSISYDDIDLKDDEDISETIDF